MSVLPQNPSDQDDGSMAEKKTQTSEDKKEHKAPTDKKNSTDELAKEIGGVAGPEPVRYGDWEKKGRCIDF